MRILFVAMCDSIHAARWINQIEAEAEVHLFPAFVDTVHPKLLHVPIYGMPAPLVGQHQAGFWHRARRRAKQALKRMMPPRLRAAGRALCAPAESANQPSIEDRAKLLADVIQRVQPDVVHSMEFQHAGYLTLKAKERLGNRFPTWIATNWGSDIYLFGRLKSHANRVRAILQQCDYYSCECCRDVKLARQFGLRGQPLPVFPNAGGYDLERLSRLRGAMKTSERRLILLKGYQHWAGRALTGLRALELCADELRGYRMAIYTPFPDVRLRAELFESNTGIPVEFVPPCPHEEMLGWFAQARVYLGLSISDGICTSMLDAIVTGAFPIQSDTACTDEWIEDGISGLVVPPEDPEPVARALRRALTDDGLVDRAAEINLRTARQRLDERIIAEKIRSFYRGVRLKRAAA